MIVENDHRTGEPHASCCGKVDVHAHYLPAVYRQALIDGGHGLIEGVAPLPEWSAERHLAMMDENAVDTSVVSITAPGLSFLAAPAARAMARAVNEAGAELKRLHPGRFGFYAVLPLPDVTASLAELAYALDVLGADGVAIDTNYDGRYLGDDAFAPLFDALDARGSTLFVHPTSPACMAAIGLGLIAPVIEYPFETTRFVVDLLCAGVLQRCPDLNVILSHGGGTLPLLAQRIAGVLNAPFLPRRPAGGSAEVKAQLRRLHYDLALASTPEMFMALRRITSLDHILFGSDYPCSPPNIAAQARIGFDQLMDQLTPAERRLVERGNAEILFPRLLQHAAA